MVHSGAKGARLERRGSQAGGLGLVLNRHHVGAQRNCGAAQLRQARLYAIQLRLHLHNAHV